jgi:hypothetical protein
MVPLTIADNPVGAPGVQGAPLPTVTTTSLVAPLTPAEFFARTRTKYVPAGTPDTVNDVAVFPVSKTAAFARPDAKPASTM